MCVLAKVFKFKYEAFDKRNFDFAMCIDLKPSFSADRYQYVERDGKNQHRVVYRKDVETVLFAEYTSIFHADKLHDDIFVENLKSCKNGLTINESKCQYKSYGENNLSNCIFLKIKIYCLLWIFR